MSDEERIGDYIRARADVSVPDDLRVLPGRAVSGRVVTSSIGRVASLAAVALAAAFVISVASLNQPRAVGPGSPGATAGAEATGPTSGPVDASFPSEVAGLPVLTVAHARDLLRAGRLDGQVVAVAGYYSEFAPSCPYPGRYVGPFESWCRFVAFADKSGGARLCAPEGANGTSCHQPQGVFLAPFFVSDTSGDASAWLTFGGGGEPTRLVLIGHADDPRAWQCTAATHAECAAAFVVDRIAWAEGHELPLAAPPATDLRTGTSIAPRMALDQVAAAAGLAGNELLTGAAFTAGDIATIDPRWNRAGDGIVWLVRSLDPAPADGSEARAATVWLVDDATGSVIDSQPLQSDSAYQPAQLWSVATVHGQECCPGGGLYPFVRVVDGAGATVYDGIVSGGASGDQDSTNFGGGYNSLPLVLPAGDYSVSGWLANYPGGQGAPQRECETQITLRPLSASSLNADYPAGAACSFRPAAAPTAAP